MWRAPQVRLGQTLSVSANATMNANAQQRDTHQTGGGESPRSMIDTEETIKISSRICSHVNRTDKHTHEAVFRPRGSAADC